MKKLIIKIKNWIIKIMGGCSRETVTRYENVLNERIKMIDEIIALMNAKDVRIAYLEQRERDLLDVIHEQQVEEMMRGADEYAD